MEEIKTTEDSREETMQWDVRDIWEITNIITKEKNKIASKLGIKFLV